MMEFLSSLWKQVSRIYGRLTASQRVTFLLLVAMIGGSLVLLVVLGGRGEWVPLTRGALTPQEMSKAAAQLQQAGISFRESGGQIVVPSGDRHRATAVLSEAGALPANAGAFGWNDLINQSGGLSNLRTSAQEQLQEQIALQTEMERTLSAFSGVRSARVLLTKTPRRSLDFRAEKVSKASVILWMEPGVSLTSQTVRSAANLVAHAVLDLAPHNVAVIDGDRSVVMRVPPDEPGFALGFLEQKHEVEKLLTQKLYRQFGHIPGILIEASVLLKAKSEEKMSHIVRPDESRFAGSEREVIRETSDGAPAESAAPAAGTMGGATVIAPAVRTTKESELETTIKDSHVSTDDLRVIDPAGQIERITASIIVPLAYYEELVASALAAGGKPDPAAVRAAADADRPQLQRLAQTVLGPKAALEDVTVEARHVPAEPVLAMVTPSGGAGQVLERYGTPGVLAGLSLVFMVLLGRWVRRPAAAAAPVAAGPVAAAEGEEDLSFLLPADGDASVEERRLAVMRKKIQELVKQDPANAAGLVGRWLSQG